jgi:hypothetical protein
LLCGALMGATGAGCSSDEEGNGEGVRVVMRPPGAGADAAPQNAILDECEAGESCIGAASCQDTCGLHELGDQACTCSAAVLTCNTCTVNAEFRSMIRSATAFCAAGTRDGNACTTKGETCMAVSYSSSGTPRREGCLCWQGRTRLEWDCSSTLNGFFQDDAPPTPPAPDGGTDR